MDALCAFLFVKIRLNDWQQFYQIDLKTVSFFLAFKVASNLKATTIWPVRSEIAIQLNNYKSASFTSSSLLYITLCSILFTVWWSWRTYRKPHFHTKKMAPIIANTARMTLQQWLKKRYAPKWLFLFGCWKFLQWNKIKHHESLARI